MSRVSARHREIAEAMAGRSLTVREVAALGCYASESRALATLRRWERAGLAVETRNRWQLTRASKCEGGARRPLATAEAEWTRGPAGEFIGAAGNLWDGEGRRYRYRYRVVSALDLLPSQVASTLLPSTRYPQELQPRDRAGIASRAQIDALAQTLDPARLLAPSSTPAEGAPVVWPRADHELAVVAGNGRALALLRAPSERRAAYEAAILALVGLSTADTGELPLNPVLVRVLENATLTDAVRLAGASQAAAAAELTPIERAVSVGRAVGVDGPDALRQLGPLRWAKPVRSDTWRAFAAQNREWVAAALGRLDLARRPSVQADAEAAARYAGDLLVAGLPLTSAQWAGGLGDRPAAEALRGALPAVWTLDGAIAAGAVRPGWGLLSEVLTARRLYALAGSRGIAALSRDVGEAGRTVAMDLGDDLPGLGELSPLGVALGVLLLRAGRRADAQAAAAEYLARYLLEAEVDDPRQVGLLGPASSPEPAAVLSAIVGWHDPRASSPNPTRRRRTWVWWGSRVSFAFEDGSELDLGDDWVLATQPAYRSLVLVQRRRSVDASALATSPAADGYRKMARGLPANAAWAACQPSAQGARTVGRTTTIYYDGHLAGDRVRRYHVFSPPGPLLLLGADGPILSRGGSRYSVTRRGIVG